MSGAASMTLLPKREDRFTGSTENLGSTKHDDDDDEDDWWASDSGSSSGSYYSDTDSSIVEWKSEVGPTGEVFYIEPSPDTLTYEQGRVDDRSKSPAPELTRRRSTRAGKLMRLIRRRESKRYSTRNKRSVDAASAQNEGDAQRGGSNGNKEVTFSDCQSGEIREVTLWVDPEKRHKLGRRATLSEAYLGITPGTFSDKVRVMIAGLIPDGQATKIKSVKIGDWLRSVNSREVTCRNLDQVLSAILTPMNVKIEVQRVAGVEVTTRPSAINFPKQSILVRQLVKSEESKLLMESLLDHPVGAIFLNTAGLSETGPELQGVLYSFPRGNCGNANSIMCNARGAFITLNHMLSEIIGPRPISTTAIIIDRLVHITYASRGEKLFLMALPDNWCSLQESLEITADIARALEFNYQSLERCFSTEEHHVSLDRFFSLIFWRLSNAESHGVSVCQYSARDAADNAERCEFESILPAVHLVRLPRDAQIQIDAALNEMEAMDYRDWNEDPMDCQRLYTILGSCLYHRSYLLGSHLPCDDLVEVHSFLRQNGILNLVNNEPMKSLVIWRRVYPPSCERGCSDSSQTRPSVPDGKWFLLVVGYGHELLAVLLESGGCTAEYEDNAPPDIFYVEEAQETLKHVQKIGISTLVAKWLSANARPEVIYPEDCTIAKTTSNIAENLLGFIKSPDSQGLASSKASASPTAKKKTQEVPSILKKRSPEQSPVALGSVYSLQTSEDSTSQGTGAVSEVSDEAAPILGRRATRERNNAMSRHSEDSDSDVDIYRNDIQTNAANISDIRENLLNQAEYMVPRKLTTGEKNSLFHYVHLDTLEGVLLSSRTVENCARNARIMANFNKTAHVVHKLLHNAVRFKKMLSRDVDKLTINKSLIAIKEHGVLFEADNLAYWVVGRLYATPHPKELYVCYRDGVPQNLVEMAFRLNSA